MLSPPLSWEGLKWGLDFWAQRWNRWEVPKSTFQGGGIPGGAGLYPAQLQLRGSVRWAPRKHCWADPTRSAQRTERFGGGVLPAERRLREPRESVRGLPTSLVQSWMCNSPLSAEVTVSQQNRPAEVAGKFPHTGRGGRRKARVIPPFPSFPGNPVMSTVSCSSPE